MNREKKQLIVMGVLALMVVCVGAFQMIGGTSAPPPPKTTKEPKPETSVEPKDEALKVTNPDQGIPLAKRDPFAPSAFAVEINTDPALAAAEAAEKRRQPERLPNARGKKGSTVIWEPSTPFTPGGKVGGELPVLKVDAPKFSYSVAGFVNGDVKAVVFRDASGQERLVEVGSAIDSSSTLVAVNGNSVKVKFYDRTLVLTVGGNPSAK